MLFKQQINDLDQLMLHKKRVVYATDACPENKPRHLHDNNDQQIFIYNTDQKNGVLTGNGGDVM